MFKFILSEVSCLNKNSKLITLIVLSISLFFCLMSINILINKTLQTVDTYNLAIELYQTSVSLFLEAFTIGILINKIKNK